MKNQSPKEAFLFVAEQKVKKNDQKRIKSHNANIQQNQKAGGKAR